MSSYAVRSRSARLALACTALLALAACERVLQGREPAGEMSWARAALERNPQIEVVAADPQSQVFTVRDRSTGEVRAVQLGDIAAVPVSQLSAAAAPPTASAAGTTATPPTPSAAAATPGAASPTAPATSAISAAPAAAADAPAETNAESTQDSDQRSSSAADLDSSDESNYTIERTGDQVRISGPGVSIVSSGRSAAAGTEGEAGLRTVEPIICEGRRMVHFDNRRIYVDGNAITVRGGCEMFITNSRIVASGTGVVVEDGVVHVSNSHVEGANRSFAAADEARMYVRGSTFNGLSQRAELAEVQDQGGNRWR